MNPKDIYGKLKEKNKKMDFREFLRWIWRTPSKDLKKDLDKVKHNTND